MNKRLLLLMLMINGSKLLFANSFTTEYLDLSFKNGRMYNLEYSEILNHPDSLRLSAFDLSNKEAGVELALNFEYQDELESRPYVMINGAFNRSNARARTGAFAGSFMGDNSVILRPTASSIFGGAQRNPSFSIAFWVNPLRLGDGEVIFSYESPVEYSGQYFYQSIKAFVEVDRVVWRFENIFFDGNAVPLIIELVGEPILRGHWSHQMVSFDAQRGFLQLLNNSELVATRYTNEENSAIHPTMMAHFQYDTKQQVVLGNFLGYLDGVIIAQRFFENANLSRYEQHGYYLSDPISISGRIIEQLRLESQAQEYAEVRLFARSALGAQILMNMEEESGWQLVDDQFLQNLASSSDRFLQVRLDFYAGKSQASTPIVQGFQVVYHQSPRPATPGRLSYTKMDEDSLIVRWQPVMVNNVAGYRLYFGTQSGEYFGHFEQGSSPLDIGSNLSIQLDGLKNGQMYYMALVAYDELGRESDFSPELIVLY